MFGKEELMRFMFGFCLQEDKVASFHHFQVMVDKILQYESSVVRQDVSHFLAEHIKETHAHIYI